MKQLTLLLAMALSLSAAVDSTKTTTAKSSSTTAKPASAPAKSSSTTAKPASAPAKSSSTTEKSASAPAKSSSTTAKPASAPAKSSSTTAKPASAPAKSSTTTEKSASAPAKSSSTSAKPASAPAKTASAPTKSASEKSTSVKTGEQRSSSADQKKSEKTESSAAQSAQKSTKRDSSDSKKDTTVSDSAKTDSAPVSKPRRSADTLVLIDSSSYFDTAQSAVNDSVPDTVPSAEKEPELQDAPVKTGGMSAVSALITAFFAASFAIAALGAGVFILIKRAARRKKRHRDFLTQTRISIMNSEVQLVCRYIENHYDEPDLSPESICTALTTGKTFVETLFRKELDMSLEQFIMHVRVHHALSFIGEGISESEQLPELCGYSDLAQFTEDFKTITGKELQEIMNRKENA